MKNQELLKTGGKPAPGELVLVQGFVNTIDIEEGVDQIRSEPSLKSWLVRHGLLRSDAKVTSQDHRMIISLREALRRLMLANNGDTVQPAALKEINRLVSRFKLAARFKTDGSLDLVPDNYGSAAVCGQILALVVQAVSDGTWFRLKACDEPNCRWAFYDGSRNHSGRWCSMSVCGSRDKARAYRRRRTTAEK